MYLKPEKVTPSCWASQVDHYSEYPRGHIVVFFVQLPEAKSLGARVKEREAKLDRRLIYVPYIGCIALVGQRGVGGTVMTKLH